MKLRHKDILKVNKNVNVHVNDESIQTLTHHIDIVDFHTSVEKAMVDLENDQPDVNDRI